MAKFAIQAVFFVILLCPLGVLYLLGLPISAGISLWRLIKHDYGNTDEVANLKPALHVLYSLAVVQGALFCYRASYASAAKHIVKDVARFYMFKDRRDLIWDYLLETRTRCEEDPSFGSGRNLITYAVDQMNSMSPDNYISGVRILSKVIKLQKSGRFKRIHQDLLIGQHVLIKHLLIGSASGGHVLRKLLWTLDSSCPYDIETRKSAARIVAYIAGDICLEQYPGGIRCISSLLDTSECRVIEPYMLDWKLEQSDLDCPTKTYTNRWPVNSEPPRRCKGLVLHGLRILRKIAATGEENCRVISNAHGLVLRIIAPLKLDLPHSRGHCFWDDIVKESLKVMERLTTAPGWAGKNLRRQIVSNMEVISSMENILKCGDCDSLLQQLSMGILAQLYMDASLSMDTESRKKYVNSLLCIFASGKDMTTRMLAGQKLATLVSKNRSNDMIISKIDDVIDNLTGIILEDLCEEINRITAAEILEQLVMTEYHDKLKHSLIDVMSKVLRDILGCKSKEFKGTTAAENGRFSIPGTDIEGQDRDASPDGEWNSTPARKEKQKEKIRDRKLLEALLSLSVTMFDKLTSSDDDLALYIDAIIAPGYAQFSLPRELKEMVERNSEHTTDCLKILKLITMMVISMMKHRSCIVNDELNGLVQALHSASEHMKVLDGFMIFESEDDGTRTKKPFRTLVSLVDEAQDLVDKLSEP